MKGIIFVVTLLFLTQIIFPYNIESHSLNNTLYVGGSGPGNYSSIQAAIDDAKDGYTIIVYPGTYNENIIVSKQLTIIGKDRDATVIDGGMKSDVVLITADNVKIQGFTITNSGDIDNYAGIRIHNYTYYCEISDCSILNSNRGVFGYYIYHATIKNCTISNIYRKSGVALYYSNHNCIWNLTINDINWTGIYFYGGKYNTIKKCNISNCGAYGITLDYSDYCIVSDCEIKNSLNGIKLAKSNYNEFLGNVITGSVGSGIVFYVGSNENTISSCYLYKNGYNGIYMRRCRNNWIEKNRIEENNRSGIYMESSNANTISRCNIIKNRQCGVYLKRCLEIIVNYSNIYDSGFGIGIFANESYCDARYNYWGTIFGPLTFGLLGDGIAWVGDANIKFFPWSIFKNQW